MSQNPVVTITMAGGGEIKLELLPEKAPNTVNNFIHLVQKGFYNGLIFHRVIPGFMIQGGDPQGTGIGGPGYQIGGEFTCNGFEGNDIEHGVGVISMARANDPDSVGSQFFITVAPAFFLDGNYAAFGQVVSGQEEAERIAGVKRDYMDKPLDAEVMQTVTVETFGVDYPEPCKA